MLRDLEALPRNGRREKSILNSLNCMEPSEVSAKRLDFHERIPEGDRGYFIKNKLSIYIIFIGSVAALVAVGPGREAGCSFERLNEVAHRIESTLLGHALKRKGAGSKQPLGLLDPQALQIL